MEKKKMKKLVAICSIMMLFLCSIPCVFAGSANYSGTFPKYSGHTTLVQGIRETQKKEAYNTISGPASTTRGFFWIDLVSNGSLVAPEVHCQYNTKTPLPYSNDGIFTGLVKLRARAGTWSTSTYEVSGTVDFS